MSDQIPPQQPPESPDVQPAFPGFPQLQLNRFRFVTKIGFYCDALIPDNLMGLVGSMKVNGHFLNENVYIPLSELDHISRVDPGAPADGSEPSNVTPLRPQS